MIKIPDKFAIVALVILAASPAYAGDARSHDDEIKLFATMMAIAKTGKAGCPGVEVDDRYLEAVRQRLQVVEADQPTFAIEARAFAKVLQRAQGMAPSRQAWCAAVFRLNGPDGKLMRGMLRR